MTVKEPTPRQAQKEVDRLLMALTKPFVVYDTAWAESLPEWIKIQVEMDRLAQLLKHEEGVCTLSEALAYLYTATFVQPFNHDWTQIYCWLTKKCMTAAGKNMPDDLAPESLTPEQERELNKFRSWLWNTTSKHAPRIPRNGHPVEARNPQLQLF